MALSNMIRNWIVLTSIWWWMNACRTNFITAWWFRSISMGGEILVYEGMHYANWGNTEEYGRIAYSGVNGSYAFPNLDAGF